MPGHFVSLLMKLARSREGNASTVFAIMAFPLALAAGGALDVTNVFTSKAKLQASLDAAVLSGVSRPQDLQSDAASRAFSANLQIAPNLASGASATFTPVPASHALQGSAQIAVKTTLLNLIGLKTMTVRAASAASMPAPDQSCILTFGTGMGANTASMVFNGAPSVNLDGCGLRSNTSISCHGHNGSAIQSLAVGTAAGCSNPTTAASVPDIYSDRASNISLKCGGATPGGTWTPSAKPGGSQMVTVARTGYTEYHVCGTLALSGSGTLSGLGSSGDSVVIVENGAIDVQNGANVSAPRTAFVLTGSNTSSHTITFPQGKGQGSTLSITPPITTQNPWQDVAIYQDPVLTKNVDITWGPGATLTADGLIYLPRSNVTMSGNGNSNNTKCTKFAVNSFTTNGNVNLNFSQSGCSAIGFQQWVGSPALTN